MSNQYFMNQPFWMSEMYYGHPEEREPPSYDQGRAAASQTQYCMPPRPSLPQSDPSLATTSQLVSDSSHSVGVKVLSQSNKKEFKLYTLKRMSEDCMKVLRKSIQ